MYVFVCESSLLLFNSDADTKSAEEDRNIKPGSLGTCVDARMTLLGPCNVLWIPMHLFAIHLWSFLTQGPNQMSEIHPKKDH